MARIVSIGWPGLLLALMLASAPTLDYFLNSPDMGYQLCLGHLVLWGEFPFVNMIQHYGPLVGLTSAAGQWVHHSVVPEVVICSLGYCLAMTCVFRVVMRGAAARPGRATLVGMAASLAAWCVLAKFYKWYYWCFPMLMLVCLSHVCEDCPRRRLWRFAAGLIAGVGFLYRHDLGAAGLFAAVAMIAAQAEPAPSVGGTGTREGAARAQPPLRTAIELAWLTGGFLLPLACWFAVLAAMGGPLGRLVVPSAIWSGTSGTAEHWRLPLPRWDWCNPASSESCRCHLLVVMGLSYATAILLGARALLHDHRHRPPDAVPLLAAGILGLAISPQALYRPDTQHILQIIPPLLVAAALLLLRLLDGRYWERQAGAVRAARAAVAAAYLALLVFPFACLHRELRADLAPLGRNLPQRYRALAAGLDVADSANPVVQAARAVQLRTTPGQPIIVTPLMPQIYFWTDRPMSGLLNGYAGIFAQDSWRRLNLEAIQQNPPALVVADRDFLHGNPDSLLKKYNPELYDRLKQRYPRVVAECGNFVLFAK